MGVVQLASGGADADVDLETRNTAVSVVGPTREAVDRVDHLFGCGLMTASPAMYTVS